MPTQRTILESLTSRELRTAVDDHELVVEDRRVRAQLIDALARARRARIGEILLALRRDRLKDICRALQLDEAGRSKTDIVTRIIRGGSRPERGGRLPPREPPSAAGEKRARRKDEPECRTPAHRRAHLASGRSTAGDGSVSTQTHDELKGKIWEIANRLRGPYRPPQYRSVMLPMVVLRRLDCVLEETKDAVLKRHAQLEAQDMPETAMERLLGKAADPQRKHPLYNTSPYTFARLLGDAENIAPNLASYISGFSPTARIRDRLTR